MIAGVIFWIEDVARIDADVPSPFDYVPHAMWFTLVTVSTVGYGDVTPATPAGKAWASLLILFGVGDTAMPLAIIGGQFREVWS